MADASNTRLELSDLRYEARSYLSALGGVIDARQRKLLARQAFELARRASLMESWHSGPAIFHMPVPKGFKGKPRRTRARPARGSVVDGSTTS